MPAVYGLYGSFLPLAVYALLGSSRQLGVVPVASGATGGDAGYAEKLEGR